MPDLGDSSGYSGCTDGNHGALASSRYLSPDRGESPVCHAGLSQLDQLESRHHRLGTNGTQWIPPDSSSCEENGMDAGDPFYHRGIRRL